MDGDSPSLQKNTSFSINGSPNSADSKPAVSRRSTKSSATPDKYSRLLKGSESQAQLASVQEGLRKAKEKLVFEGIKKANVLEELSRAKKAVEEVNKKLGEALVALKKAEENSELDEFRADEKEQSASEAARRREEKWHAVDIITLLAATRDLRRVKQELAMAIDAKKSALREADETMKFAEINAAKVEILSGEIELLESMLDPQLEKKSSETALVIQKLGYEAEALKLELLKAKVAVDDWKKKTQLLDSSLEEEKQSESAVQDSLASLIKQLEESNSLLDYAESEVFCLKEKAKALELEVERHKTDFEESDHQLDSAKQEVLDVEKKVAALKSEIQRAEKVKTRALNNEKLRSSNVGSLTQINNKLEIEIGITGEDSEKSKKAMEGLASAFHEVSMEARDLQERLLIKQAEVETITGELDNLELALKITQETYEVMLDEAKYEIVCLKKAIDKSEAEAKDLRAEWDAKEINLRTAIEKADEEIASIRVERDEAMEKLVREKFHAKAAVEEADKHHHKISQAESELIEASGAIEKEKAESKCLKERLLFKEKALQRITQESDELGVCETASSEMVKELSESLAKLSFKKNREHGDSRRNTEYESNQVLSDNGEEHNILHEMIVVMDDNAAESEDDRKQEENEAEGYPVKMEARICAGGEAMGKEMVSEDELEAKFHVGSLVQLIGHSVQNGRISISKHQLLQKRKKALLNKFGDLLKKKSASK